MKYLMTSLLIASLVTSFGLVAKAGVSALPHVFNLSFDDKSNSGKEQSGNGNRGELKGGAKWTDKGHTGGAVEFDGTKAHVEVMVDVPENNFTMGVWIKTDQGDVGIYSVLDKAAGEGGHDRHFFLKDGKINFRTWRGPAWATDKKVSDGKWHHIALVVQDKKGQIAYVDGSKVGTHDYDHSDFDWQKRVWVGFSNDAAVDYFEGIVDEVVYLDVPLSTNEVSALMKPLTVEKNSKLATIWSQIKTDH